MNKRIKIILASGLVLIATFTTAIALKFRVGEKPTLAQSQIGDVSGRPGCIVADSPDPKFGEINAVTGMIDGANFVLGPASFSYNECAHHPFLTSVGLHTGFMHTFDTTLENVSPTLVRIHSPSGIESFNLRSPNTFSSERGLDGRLISTNSTTYPTWFRIVDFFGSTEIVYNLIGTRWKPVQIFSLGGSASTYKRLNNVTTLAWENIGGAPRIKTITKAVTATYAPTLSYVYNAEGRLTQIVGSDHTETLPNTATILWTGANYGYMYMYGIVIPGSKPGKTQATTWGFNGGYMNGQDTHFLTEVNYGDGNGGVDMKVTYQRPPSDQKYITTVKIYQKQPPSNQLVSTATANYQWTFNGDRTAQQARISDLRSPNMPSTFDFSQRRIVKSTDGFAKFTIYEYAGPQGQLSRFWNDQGHGLSYQFNSDGITQSVSRVKDNKLLQWVTLMDPSGFYAKKTMTAENIENEVLYSGNGELIYSRSNDRVTSLAYSNDPAGFRIVTTSFGRLASNALYDNYGRMLSNQEPGYPAPTVFTYNTRGSLTQKTAPNGEKIIFTRNSDDLIASAKAGAAPATTFSYDRFGQVTSATDNAISTAIPRMDSGEDQDGAYTQWPSQELAELESTPLMEKLGFTVGEKDSYAAPGGARITGETRPSNKCKKAWGVDTSEWRWFSDDGSDPNLGNHNPPGGGVFAGGYYPDPWNIPIGEPDDPAPTSPPGVQCFQAPPSRCLAMNSHSQVCANAGTALGSQSEIFSNICRTVNACDCLTKVCLKKDSNGNLTNQIADNTQPVFTVRSDQVDWGGLNNRCVLLGFNPNTASACQIIGNRIVPGKQCVNNNCSCLSQICVYDMVTRTFDYEPFNFQGAEEVVSLVQSFGEDTSKWQHCVTSGSSSSSSDAASEAVAAAASTGPTDDSSSSSSSSSSYTNSASSGYSADSSTDSSTSSGNSSSSSNSSNSSNSSGGNSSDSSNSSGSNSSNSSGSNSSDSSNSSGSNSSNSSGSNSSDSSNSSGSNSSGSSGSSGSNSSGGYDPCASNSNIIMDSGSSSGSNSSGSGSSGSSSNPCTSSSSSSGSSSSSSSSTGSSTGGSITGSIMDGLLNLLGF